VRGKLPGCGLLRKGALHDFLITDTILLQMENENNKEVVNFHALLKKTGLSVRTIGSFRRIIKQYYRRHGRHDLPWRKTVEPYRILVSEIMLQQTQVERAYEKYGQFIKAFPDFHALAKAPLRDVLSQWQGLGYNRRAMFLHKTARIVIDEHKGVLPSSVDELLALPGIGKATAASIITFAFNRPVIFIETNIRGVFIHFFFKDEKNIRDAEILPLAEKALIRSSPREWYYALMDYGSVLKKEAGNPNIRSAHYQRQSRFEGSNRQVRGRVLKAVIHNPGLSEKDIAQEIKVDIKRTRAVLQQLSGEGFIKKGGSGYSV
jgi:A/G-specific adenine glycosylase